MILLDTMLVAEAMQPQANARVTEWLDGQDLETLFLAAVRALAEGAARDAWRARVRAESAAVAEFVKRDEEAGRFYEDWGRVR